jgi:hypothetical protein
MMIVGSPISQNWGKNNNKKKTSAINGMKRMQRKR